MKKLSLALALPIMGMASHSFEMGGFYTQHKEKNYSYNLSGISLNYEIGNSKGLKAVGKIHFSNEDDLPFFLSRSEFHYFIPLQNFELIPFIGVHSLHHTVVKMEGMTAIMQRFYFPVGMGLKATIDDFVGEFRFAHLFPMGHSITQQKDDSFIGRTYELPACYFLEGKVGYQIGEKITSFLSGTWQQDFKQKSRTWMGELIINFKF